MARTKLTIEGMHCDHCIHTVKHALEGVEGVRSARVDLDGGTALVDYDDGTAELEAMGAAVADAGYAVKAD